MKTEKEVYNFLSKHFPLWDWFRIENAVSSGIPDTNCHFKNKDIWLELKIGKPLLRPAQRAWFHRAGRVGRRAFVLVYDPAQLTFWVYRCPLRFNETFFNGKHLVTDSLVDAFLLKDIDILPLLLTK